MQSDSSLHFADPVEVPGGAKKINVTSYSAADPIIMALGTLYDRGSAVPTRSFSAHILPDSEAAQFYGISMKYAPLRGLLVDPSAFPEPEATGPAAQRSGAFMNPFSDRTRPVLLLAPDLVPVNCVSASAAASGAVAAARPSPAARPGHLRPGRQQAPEDAPSLPVDAPGACAVPALAADAAFVDKEAARRALLKELAASVGEAFAEAETPAVRSLHAILGLAPPVPVGAGANASSSSSPSHAHADRHGAHHHHHHHSNGSANATSSASATASALPKPVVPLHGHRRRSLFIRPSNSKGARSMLAVKMKFAGQADTVLASDADMHTLMDGATSELNRAAFGAATFTYTLPAGIITLDAGVATCTSDMNAIESSARAQTASALGIDSSTFNHFLMLMPDCTASYGWVGLASTPGRTIWVNGAGANRVHTTVQ